MQIVKLWDIFADGAYLSLVFEYVETDLFSVRGHGPLSGILPLPH